MVAPSWVWIIFGAVIRYTTPMGPCAGARLSPQAFGLLTVTVVRYVPVLLSACIMHEEAEESEGFQGVGSEAFDFHHVALSAHGTEDRMIVVG
jgi:hypothetical protein